MPDFAILNGDGIRSTLDHVGQFIIEYGEASFINNCKLRFFLFSLSLLHLLGLFPCYLTWFIFFLIYNINSMIIFY